MKLSLYQEVSSTEAGGRSKGSFRGKTIKTNQKQSDLVEVLLSLSFSLLFSFLMYTNQMTAFLTK